MSSKIFLNKENINMLWDVISDEDIFKFLSRDIQNKILTVFTSNLKGFFESEMNQTNNLIDINKKYIILILSYIKKNYSHQPNKIKILEEISPTVLKELITSEEIQNNRKSQFEKELSKRQEDFTNAMTPSVPTVPEFGDKLQDTPITEMEKIIKEMTAQRNYDVEQINKSYQQSDDWLKSQETSIKNEKHISTENKEIKLNSPEKRKNVSWGENSEIINNLNLDEDSIFKKLKKTNQPTITFEDTIINDSKEDRIKNLEHEVKSLNIKIDMLINLLKQNK